jgi:acetyl-CoA acetyltransferase
MIDLGERRSIISGVGGSERVLASPASALQLGADACLAAVADAGLTLDDIDGLATWPGSLSPMGTSPTGIVELQHALRLRLSWYTGGDELPGPLGVVLNGIAAVASGLARNVLCVVVTKAGSTRKRGMAQSIGPRISNSYKWLMPFGAYAAPVWIGMVAQRYMHSYGLTRADLGSMAIAMRQNAARNPLSIFRDPLTMEKYLNSRTISTPFCLFDCDVPVDGAIAVVVSRADVGSSLRRPPLRIEAVGSGGSELLSWDQRANYLQMANVDAAEMLFRRTSLRAADVDVLQIYDGFSFFPFTWLEALGYAKWGEAAKLVGESSLDADGTLPINTCGGQLSAGRLYGFGLLEEGCRQLWGEASGRQIPGAEVGIVGVGGGPTAACLMLTRS